MNKWVSSGLLLGSAAVLLSRQSKNKIDGDGTKHLAQGIDRDEDRSSAPERPPSAGERQTAEDATRRYITYAMLPCWGLAGALDWLWHRQTKIESTSGTEESVMHLLMMAEAGLPIMMGLFMEVNAGVFAGMIGGLLLHQLTVIWDVKYTAPRRLIPVREQHTHVFMETIPFDIAAVLACLHWEQFLALFGAGPEKPRFALRLKQPPVPLSHAAAILAGMALFVGAPHVEELWRCWKAEQEGLKGRDTPECARELYAS
jgi:hypothetical protein